MVAVAGTYLARSLMDPAPVILCRPCLEGADEGDEFAGHRVVAVAVRARHHDASPAWTPVCYIHDEKARADEDVPDLPVLRLPTWWVVIERSFERDGVYYPDLAIGPYPDARSAGVAMEAAVLVEGELQSPGGTDCYIDEFSGPHVIKRGGYSLALIHLDDPTYTGLDPERE